MVGVSLDRSFIESLIWRSVTWRPGTNLPDSVGTSGWAKIIPNNGAGQFRTNVVDDSVDAAPLVDDAGGSRPRIACGRPTSSASALAQQTGRCRSANRRSPHAASQRRSRNRRHPPGRGCAPPPRRGRVVLAGVAARPADVLREVLQQLAALRVRVPVATAVLGQPFAFGGPGTSSGSAPIPAVRMTTGSPRVDPEPTLAAADLGSLTALTLTAMGRSPKLLSAIR
jgi:hypothetical protein